jgi:hypothetical protein
MSVLNLARAIVAELDGRVSHGTVLSDVPWDSGCRPGAYGANGTHRTHGADLTAGATVLETCLDAPPRLAARSDGCNAGVADVHELKTRGFPSRSARAAVQRTEISAALDRLPVASTREGRLLLSATRQFITSRFFIEAIRCAWTLNELFGLDSFVPLDEAAWGLVVGLALAPRKSDEIISIDEEAAVISSGLAHSWHRRIERRFLPPIDAVVWWRCEGIIASDGA